MGQVTGDVKKFDTGREAVIMNMFLLGIDGLPRWMWQQFADSGVMPNSAKLLRTGTLVPMKSALPEVSSAAWASIVTGENSGGQ